MNKEEFLKEIKDLGINYTEDEIKKIDIYLNFLKEYNEHTNLTAIKEDRDVYLKHFYDSLTIIKAVDLSKVNNLIDVGTGAGFPGMVIKIFYNNIDITLLDSNNKKIKFLEELTKQLGIKVNIINDRVENYSKTHLNQFEIVTARAVTNMRVLSELLLPLVTKEGYFVPLKADIKEELEEALSTIKIMKGTIIKRIDFELYKSNGKRCILVIKKEQETTENELRSYDKIIKKPLQIINK